MTLVTGNPDNSPGGFCNYSRYEAMGLLPIPDPTKINFQVEEFNKYVAGDWTVTKVGSGGTAALAGGLGGVLAITTDTTSGNSVYLQATSENFAFQSGKKLWFQARVNNHVAAQGVAIAGLQITDTTPTTVSDGVWFSKNLTTGVWQANVYAASTGTAAIALGVTAVADTYDKLAFIYDGTDLRWFINDNLVYTTTAAVLANLPTHTLAISFGNSTNASAASILNVDNILVACER